MAGAAAPAPSRYADQVVRCESRDMERVHCDLEAPGGIQLARQLSERSCIRESTWGADASGVWVSHGCRAEFSRITPASARPTRRVIRCESSGRPQSCPVILRGAPVRLLKQHSAMPCREGHSWGVKRNELWVTRGCQGEFEVGAEDGSGFVDIPRKLVCESKGGLRRECGVSVQHRVTLLRQLSGTPCEEGRNWGWTRDGVWVDKGCRAEFSAD
ncbi:DUF3011 domain-containing protein [Stenotrophomonas sp. YIM B06876]|uniref:DUF3011 domain-containing protein n=1 Tax=Stenotrophomonas sp. YIM B06876 TaxID=3060211 RepID=UPI002739F0C9|nr:DUF3011 domain-containing protein [Stenotrophomonas sp. YIM B06876]